MKNVLRDNRSTARPARTAGALAAASAFLALSACGGESSDAEAGRDADDAIELINDDALTVCGSFANPPNIFREEDGTEVGVEVEIAAAMAEHMGLDIDFLEYSFSGLIPALQGGQCDVIMSSLYIRPEREEVADFVPYMMAGSGVAVSEENPQGITGYDDSLCGVRGIAVTGSTGAGLLEERSEECESGGQPGIDITLVDRGADALQQIVAGQQDAYLNTIEQVLYFEQESDGAFQLVGEPFGEIAIGAASLKGNEGLHVELSAAFDELVDSGRYDEILTTWGLERQSIVDA